MWIRGRTLAVTAMLTLFALPARPWAGPAALAQTTAPAVVSLTSAQTASYGAVLTTADGIALYMLTFDTVGTASTPAASNCSGNCAKAWPPLLAPTPFGPFQVSGGVQASALGTIVRPDGPYQVTYDGHPLYMFIRDTAAGQMNGENVAAFNGLWSLVSVSGQPAVGAATVSLESTANGTVLSSPTAGNASRSLYLLTADPPNASTCFGACARFWPPLLTNGTPVAGAGVDPSGLGTIRRPDGTMQVTYFGLPVYFFAFDLGPGAKPGLTNGEEVVNFSGIWYLISPGGAPVASAAAFTSVSSPIGTLLAYDPSRDPKGAAYPVYAFSADTTSSTCTGLCAHVWTPVLTSAAPTVIAGSGVTAAGLGTITRADGTMQVTYHGHPLYTFSQDYAGTSGQGIRAFGGAFQLLTTSGATTTTAPTTRSVVAFPQVTKTPAGVAASFVVAFSSANVGQGMVLFGSGPGCTGLVETATTDLGAGTTSHTVVVSGNDLADSVGNNGIQPGATYSYEVVTVSSAGPVADNNKGACYTITIPSS